MLLAVVALMVTLLAIQTGPAMAQSFSNRGNNSDQNSFIVTGDDVFFDDLDDDFDRCRDFNDVFRCDGEFFVEVDEFGFFPFFGFGDFDADDFDFDFDGSGVNQFSEQEAESGEVAQSFEVS